MLESKDSSSSCTVFLEDVYATCVRLSNGDILLSYIKCMRTQTHTHTQNEKHNVTSPSPHKLGKTVDV